MNTIRSKKLATIDSGQIKVTRSFIRRKLVSTSTALNRLHTFLLYCSSCAYSFSPDKGPCFAFSNRNNCCELLASNVVILPSDHQFYFKMTVLGASLLHFSKHFFLHQSQEAIVSGLKLNCSCQR